MRRADSDRKRYVRRVDGTRTRFVRSTLPKLPKGLARIEDVSTTVASILLIAAMLSAFGVMVAARGSVLPASLAAEVGYVALPSYVKPGFKVLREWRFGNVTVYLGEGELPSGWVPADVKVMLAPTYNSSTGGPYANWWATNIYYDSMGFDRAWNGSGVTVAVIDTGIDYLDTEDWGGQLEAVVSVLYENASSGQPFIMWNLTANPNVTALYQLDYSIYKKYGHWAFLDMAGHGTAVSSVIIGQPGVNPPVAGLAPGAKLIMIKAFYGNGTSTLGLVLTALQWVYNYSSKYNIRVLSMSWGALLPPDNPLVPVLQALYAKGVVLVAAAGNYGNVPGDVAYPAASRYVIAVGALDCYTGQVAPFSSVGPGPDVFQVKPELMACGVNVPVLRPSYIGLGGVLTDPYDPDVIAWSGTSFAAPAVAALAADYIEEYHYYTGRWPSPAQVLALLTANARPLGLPNDVTGYGLARAP